ncbi:predicted protein [Naegleria gruberi]|uniref:Predicted protein n=1 Tax=Naegleria gruberi TaxID=5762 RepID=D2W152_NAEGR|nr:uncharacterized protein NAEGRDRAFT_75091 [Naegleria gruberi]EFC37170.1 predicted protein [Naegleria gruberi]|eukprot:XP_002669914.1 predicted protein [Naegleria gruberi strain NEG-M]
MFSSNIQESLSSFPNDDNDDHEITTPLSNNNNILVEYDNNSNQCNQCNHHISMYILYEICLFLNVHDIYRLMICQVDWFNYLHDYNRENIFLKLVECRFVRFLSHSRISFMKKFANGKELNLINLKDSKYGIISNKEDLKVCLRFMMRFNYIDLIIENRNVGVSDFLLYATCNSKYGIINKICEDVIDDKQLYLIHGYNDNNSISILDIKPMDITKNRKLQISHDRDFDFSNSFKKSRKEKFRQVFSSLIYNYNIKKSTYLPLDLIIEQELIIPKKELVINVPKLSFFDIGDDSLEYFSDLPCDKCNSKFSITYC